MGNAKEHGAIAVIVAVMMVVLLGFVALAVDVGMLYAEKAQLQNGADAAALAVAQDYASRGNAACQGAAPGKALGLVKSNTNRGKSGQPAVSFPAPGTVTVTAAAGDEDGSGHPLFFARIFGMTRAEVAAEASAGWGSPYGGTATLPIVFSECQFDLTGTIQVLAIHGESGGRSCISSSPSGQLIPGGFGWLQSDPGTCGVAVSLANPTAPSKSGVSEPQQCTAVFDGIDAAGRFHIKGFAVFQLLGFNFPGHSWNNNGNPGWADRTWEPKPSASMPGR